MNLLLSCFLVSLLGSVSACFCFLFLIAAVDGARGMGTFREGGMESNLSREDDKNRNEKNDA